MPEGWSIESADLVNKLLKRKAEFRIGNTSVLEIKNHVWFYDTNWASLYKKEIEAPFKIKVYY